LSAHASRRLLWLGFEVHYLAHLVVCRIGRIQPDHPPLSTFNIQAGSALGMPAEAPTIATALKAMGYATGARKPAAGNKKTPPQGGTLGRQMTWLQASSIIYSRSRSSSSSSSFGADFPVPRTKV
jgi:hypothetical protein